MTNIITALKVQRNDKSRVNVFVNGQRTFSVSLDVAATLRKGEALNGSRIEKLKREDERIRAYHAAIRFLGFRVRSKMEMRDYLNRKGYTLETVTKTVDRLIHEEYLDDRAFSRFWVENRDRFRPRSKYALQCELRQKGVADEIIENVLVDVDEENTAWLAVTSRLPLWRKLNQKDLKKKVMRFLHRRGFDYETSLNAFNRAWTCSHSKNESEKKV